MGFYRFFQQKQNNFSNSSRDFPQDLQSKGSILGKIIEAKHVKGTLSRPRHDYLAVDLLSGAE